MTDFKYETEANLMFLCGYFFLFQENHFWPFCHLAKICFMPIVLHENPWPYLCCISNTDVYMEWNVTSRMINDGAISCFIHEFNQIYVANISKYNTISVLPWNGWKVYGTYLN